MNEKMEQSKEAREQYLKEKGHVDHLVMKILEEDRQLYYLNFLNFFEFL